MIETRERLMIETRERLIAWLNDPEESDGAYIDTLDPLVRQMLYEQIYACKKNPFNMPKLPKINGWVLFLGTVAVVILSLAIYILAIYDPSGR